ncbi:methyltransferase-like protein 22 [Morone saxatilis]|uniref:methyltransferase-like protein 22 n=1 Tax=Morone saxatilis TaxID=34816 RepID=UPI0015E24FB5|nr:methyltransferase-like protein 22 [Morone saxatilis]
MDQITFHHDTVLSDVHMLLPNTCHLMTRLNYVGQPVFISKFKILSGGEKHDNNDPGKALKDADDYDDPKEGREKDTEATQGKDREGCGEGNMKPFLDEDGDLDITHRKKSRRMDSPVMDRYDLNCVV